MTKIREEWVDTLCKIATPVFDALSRDSLKQEMPLYQKDASNDRGEFLILETFGRAFAGIAPWLELENISSSNEKALQANMRQMVIRSFEQAFKPNSLNRPNFDNVETHRQPLVDASFLALGLMRSWTQTWSKFSPELQSKIIDDLKSTRSIRPGFNNWLLFSATIEAFLKKAGSDWDKMRIDYAIRQHEQWYKGDGIYGDGPDFHFDYYNSFVIQPLLYELIHADDEITEQWNNFREGIVERARRYAVVQEYFIAPDGSYPPIGRSITYRFGAFQHLGLMALKGEFTDPLKPAGVRSAMTAVMRRTHQPKDTFDEKGWLQIGLAGEQPGLGESYISSGSLYLTLFGFLPLGLPETDPFWSDPHDDWTALKIWNGLDQPADRAAGKKFY